MELKFFFSLLERNYRLNSRDYPMITDVDVRNLKLRLSYCSDNGIDGPLYDPIMVSLVQSSLAHFIYIKKYLPDLKDLPDKMPFHPNYIRFRFLDDLVTNKASVSLDSFRLYDFSPGATPMDIDKFMLKVNDLIDDAILREIVYSMIKKIQVEGEAIDRIRIFVKTKPSRVLGLLYFVLMDLYMEIVDHFIYTSLQESALNIFWCRCLNTAFLGYTDKKNVSKLDEILKLDSVLPALGLTAKVRTGLRGGRVIRPWRGKLYLDRDGHLQWERPESIVEM